MRCVQSRKFAAGHQRWRLLFPLPSPAIIALQWVCFVVLSGFVPLLRRSSNGCCWPPSGFVLANSSGFVLFVLPSVSQQSRLSPPSIVEKSLTITTLLSALRSGAHLARLALQHDDIEQFVLQAMSKRGDRLGEIDAGGKVRRARRRYVA